MTPANSTIEKALMAPKSVYRSPENVLVDSTLDREGKRAILQRWRRDAEQLAVAEGEAMTGGEPNMLSRVLQALEKV